MNSPELRTPTDWKSAAMRKRIKRRYAKEARFKAMGLGAVILSASFLLFLLVVMVGNGFRGFQQTELALPVDFTELAPGTSASALSGDQAETALQNLGIVDLTEIAIEAEYGREGRDYFTSSAWRDIETILRAHIDGPFRRLDQCFAVEIECRQT